MLGKIFYNIIIFGTIISICIFPLLVFLSKNKYKYNFKSIYKVFIFILILLILPINIADFSQIKNLICTKSEEIIENEGNIAKIPEIKFENDNTIIEIDNSIDNKINIKNNTFFNISKIIPYVWISISGIILLYNLVAYIIFIINQKKHYSNITNNKVDKILSKLCNEMKIKNVSYKISDTILTPMTIGIFNKTIIISKEILEQKEYELILKHELFHIKNKDIEYKFLLLILNCIYWFNPIIYMFINQVEEILELNCDEYVLQGKEEACRIEYAEILLNQIERTRNKQYRFSMNFANRRKNIMKRFSNIVEKSKKKSIISIATMSGILLVLSTILIVSIPNINFATIDNILNNETQKDLIIEDNNTSLNEISNEENNILKDTNNETENELVNNENSQLKVENDKTNKIEPELVTDEIKNETSNSENNAQKDTNKENKSELVKNNEIKENANNTVENKSYSNSEYIRPLECDYAITNRFGVSNNNVVHSGIDLSATSGENILAIKAGEVVLSNYKGAYGNAVIIKHDDGNMSYYTHCSRLNVEEGQKVNQGDLIAQVGSTGNSTGPHLHLEIRDKNNNAVNPENYINF